MTTGRTVLYVTLESPIGELLLLGDGAVLTGLHMQAGRKPVPIQPGWRRCDAPFDDVRAQLEQYFSGRRTAFDLPLALGGTLFQRSVWRAVQEVPYGKTITYGELARRLDRPSAARAVGRANGQNPIAVVVPCHRVVGTDGTLTGYGGGLERKQLLLDLEGIPTNRPRARVFEAGSATGSEPAAIRLLPD